MSQDLGVRGLQQTEVAGNVQFATVNAVIQLSKSVLDPHIRAFEKAAVLIARMMFQWVHTSDDTVTSYRATVGSRGFKGEKINVSKDDFDYRTLNITCELMANTPTDDMQRWNMFSGMLQNRLQIPQEEIIERMELGNPAHLKSRWLEEQMEAFAFQMFQQQKMIEMQQAMQNQGQPQGQVPPGQGPPPQEGVNQPAFDQTQGQGFNPAQGGSSPAEAAPQLTQTQV
jgi:hypothetical protein